MFVLEVVRVPVWSSRPCVLMCACKCVPVDVHVCVNACGSLGAGGRTCVRVYTGLCVGVCERLYVCWLPACPCSGVYACVNMRVCVTVPCVGVSEYALIPAFACVYV